MDATWRSYQSTRQGWLYSTVLEGFFFCLVPFTKTFSMACCCGWHFRRCAFMKVHLSGLAVGSRVSHCLGSWMEAFSLLGMIAVVWHIVFYQLHRIKLRRIDYLGTHNLIIVCCRNCQPIKNFQRQKTRSWCQAAVLVFCSCCTVSFQNGWAHSWPFMPTNKFNFVLCSARRQSISHYIRLVLATGVIEMLTS